MSRDNLSSLLDTMLDESGEAMRDAQEAEAQEKLRQEQERQASTLRKRQAGDPETPLFEDVETLTGLTDDDLKAVLNKSKPDDLLIMLATGSDTLQRRVLRNMGASSVAWLRENLAHIEDVTSAERRSAQGGVLKIANKLHAAGKIGVPEPESIGSADAPDPTEKKLRDMLCDLARIAKQAGTPAITEIVTREREPMLVGGLTCVLSGERDEELRRSLAPLRAELEKAYAQRLLWMEEALVAIAAGDDAETLRAKLKS